MRLQSFLKARLGLEDPLHCWQEVSVPSHIGISIGLPKCPQEMAAGLSPECGPGEQCVF